MAAAAISRAGAFHVKDARATTFIPQGQTQ